MIQSNWKIWVPASLMLVCAGADAGQISGACAAMAAGPLAKGTACSQKARITCSFPVFYAPKKTFIWSFLVDLATHSVTVDCVRGECPDPVQHDSSWKLALNRMKEKAVFSNYVWAANLQNHLVLAGTNHDDQELYVDLIYGPSCDPHTLNPCSVNASAFLSTREGTLMDGASVARGCRVEIL